MSTGTRRTPKRGWYVPPGESFKMIGGDNVAMTFGAQWLELRANDEAVD